jgi:hypothetical protein
MPSIPKSPYLRRLEKTVYDRDLNAPYSALVTIAVSGNDPRRLIRLALKFRRRPLSVQAFVSEAPQERHDVGNVALAIIARLVAEGSLDDHSADWTHQQLQPRVLSKGDFAANLDVTKVNRHGFVDSFQPQHLRGRIFESMPFRGRSAFVQSPVNGNISLNSGRVDVHAGLQLDVEAECDAEARPRDVVAGRGRDSNVFRFGRSSRSLHRSPELPGQNVSRRDTVFVVLFKVLGRDFPLPIDDVDARIRNAVRDGAWFGRFNEDVIGANDLRVRI